MEENNNVREDFNNPDKIHHLYCYNCGDDMPTTQHTHYSDLLYCGFCGNEIFDLRTNEYIKH
jgi:hypothetical protein